MKELLIKEKAKAYDGLIERLKDLKFAYRFSPLSDTIEEKFPELKESEDERIRKELTEYLKSASGGFLDSTIQCKTFGKWLAWLEKQGEPNPYSGVSFTYNGHTWGMCARDNGVDILLDEQLFKHLEKRGEQILANSAKTCKDEPKFHEGDIIKPKDGGHEPWQIIQVDISDKKYRFKDGCVIHFSQEDAYELVEQKPSDNIEPKFHVGDWVVFIGTESVYQVENIENSEYTLRHILGGSLCLSFSNEELIREWTIQDAKAGDVLAGRYGTFIFKGEGYCGILSDNTFIISTGNNEWAECLHPATKEQRDTLEKEMADAEYTFDFEKKELKKIW